MIHTEVNNLPKVTVCKVSDQAGVWTLAVWLQSPTDKFTIQHLRKKKNLSEQKILSTEEI